MSQGEKLKLDIWILTLTRKMNPFTICLVTLLPCLTLIKGEITVTFQADEELSGQQRLGNVAEAANLSQSGVDLAALLYEIQEFGDYWQIFSIDEQSFFYLDEKVDRDNICTNQGVCYVEVQISVTEVGGIYLEIVKALVEIKDINDNEPVFSPATIELFIPEGPPDATSYELPSATDRDSGSNSNLSYYLEPNVTSFRLEIHQNLDGSPRLTLHPENLNREMWESYELLVVARDGGEPQLSAILTVLITVLDVNDNRPTFTQREYNVTINEDERIGTIFLNVTATDRDAGENARISYSFTGAEPSRSILDSISIDGNSGAISIIDTLPSEVGPFILYLEARDHGSSVKKGQAKVIINVLDINNNPPVIVVSVLKNGEISENDGIGTPVATVRVSDADKGINKESKCTCDNENFSLHELGKNSYKVASAINLDRETVESYFITINCSDQGFPTLKASASFTIRVKDENDNDPIFTQSHYFGNITENNFVGSVILRVIASDKDDGLNKQILYEIESFTGVDMFQIDETEGLIKAADSFDREKVDLYEFRVIARDRGSPPSKPAIANVTVYVMDANDNWPKFEGDSYSITIPENMNISTVVGTVTAEDIDLGNNGRVSYMIPANYSTYPFTITDDGTILTTEVLDREKNGSFTFKVVASDHGNPPKAFEIPVTVIVKDENDNVPVITFPGIDRNNSVTLPHTTLPSSTVATIEAYDLDEPENPELLYFIVAGNNAGMFQINERTGDIILKKQMFDGDIKLYTLTILVKDQGHIQHETKATLHVRFYVSNDTALAGPVISKAQNIMIAVIISCVTIVLSIIIIVIICVIRRKDNNQKSLYGAKAYDQQKIMPSVHRNSNRSSSSRGSHDKMIYPDNGYQVDMKKGKKEVSFSLDEEQEGNVSRYPTSDQYDAVSSFRSEQVPHPHQVGIFSELCKDKKKYVCFRLHEILKKGW